MCLHIPTINKDIIEEYENKLPKKRSQDIIHQGLKGGWNICKAKGHNEKFVMPLMGAECCLPNALLHYLYLVVSELEV